MPTFLVPLHEYNTCHEPGGSEAGGQFCSKSGYLRGEAARATKLGVRFTVSPTVRTRDSGFYPTQRHVDIGLDPDEWALNRAGILSVARHEMGHVTDPAYGHHKERPAQRIIGGDKVGKQYAEEFGAWRAAIRDSGGRVQWRTVRQSLTNYLYDDFTYSSSVKDRLMRQGVASGPTSEDWERFNDIWGQELDRTLDRHVGLLRRYARRVRART